MPMKLRGFIKVENNKFWQSGNPSSSGDYVVAILYPNGMGTISFSRFYLGNGWASRDNIIGYIPLPDLLDSLNITWPEHLIEKK